MRVLTTFKPIYGKDLLKDTNTVSGVSGQNWGIVGGYDLREAGEAGGHRSQDRASMDPLTLTNPVQALKTDNLNTGLSHMILLNQ